MMKFRDKKGFSLVELMIVVAIIAILAAIAIPSFMRFALRSKTSEATSNLAGIRTGEEAYRAENDVYLASGNYPAAVPPAGGTMWNAEDAAADEFTAIGFSADGVVRYQYAAVINASNAVPFFTLTATGDLDDDGENAVYIVSNNPDTAEDRTNAAGDTAPEVYPKAILDDANDDF